MKCPKCGRELEEGQFLCEDCGEEVKFVPDFDIELEAKLSESLTSMIKEITEEPSNEQNIDIDDESIDNDIKEEVRDYFPIESVKFDRRLKIGIAVLTLLAGGCLAALLIAFIKEKKINTYEYQYEQAVAYAQENNYSEAIQYLERALAMNAEDLDARILLADLYKENGQEQSAIQIFRELLDMLRKPIQNVSQNTEQTISQEVEQNNVLESAEDTNKNKLRKESIYDKLLTIYEEQSDFVEMGEILRDCDVAGIVAKYNQYAALKPKFNKAGGAYDKIISITLSGNAQGFVYYTLDGSTPTSNSNVYETPILLEAGEYVIRAKFINMFGVESEVASERYNINLSAPPEPVVSFDSGTYNVPKLIEVFHDNNTKIYYTTDGSVPTKNSLRYTAPLEMPFGISNFSFVAINEDGLSSPIVNRTYQFEVHANFTTDLALQVLVNSLWAKGELIDIEGHVPNKLGKNQYRIQTVANVNGELYYIVYEEYLDTTGSVHDTRNIYAIHTNTADLYKAYKLDEGKYNLQPFME